MNKNSKIEKITKNLINSTIIKDSVNFDVRWIGKLNDFPFVFLLIEVDDSKFWKLSPNYDPTYRQALFLLTDYKVKEEIKNLIKSMIGVGFTFEVRFLHNDNFKEVYKPVFDFLNSKNIRYDYKINGDLPLIDVTLTGSSDELEKIDIPRFQSKFEVPFVVDSKVEN